MIFGQVDVHPTLTDRARLVQRSARVRHKETQPRFGNNLTRGKDPQIKPLFYLMGENLKSSIFVAGHFLGGGHGDQCGLATLLLTVKASDGLSPAAGSCGR